MVIYAKPFSINKLYYNNKGHGKTQAALEWSYNVLGQIHNYGDELAVLNSAQKAANCGIFLHLKFSIPKLRAKSGQISKLSVDITNGEKSIADLLMLPKYHGDNVPYTARNLNLDDCWITFMVSQKIPGDEHKIEISMGLDTEISTYLQSVASLYKP